MRDLPQLAHRLEMDAAGLLDSHTEQSARALFRGGRPSPATFHIRSQIWCLAGISIVATIKALVDVV
jgi:hypothetical protein